MIRKFNDNDKINPFKEQVVTETEDATQVECMPFPIQIFPDILRNFIVEVSQNAGFMSDFVAVGVLSAVSTLSGQKIELKVNNTWFTTPIFWFAIVGLPGSKKSHPLKFVLNPLKNFDKMSKFTYDEEIQEYEAFLLKNEHEKKQYIQTYGKVKKPRWIQYVVKDSTSESLFEVHNINKNGILLYKDELIGWINSMGQYKGGKGDEMEKFLSMFDGDELKINRVTKEPLFMDKTCMNLIGTIQPDVVSKIPKDNGFLHRFLFTNSDNKIKRYTKDEIDEFQIDNYSNFLLTTKNIIDGLSKQYTITFSESGLNEFCNVDSWICDIQESDETEPFIVEYCEKLKTYLPRFILIIKVMNLIAENENISEQVEIEDVKKGHELVKYFLQTAQILLSENKTNKEVREIATMIHGKSLHEKIKEMYLRGVSQTKISKELDTSRVTVGKVIKTLK